MNPQKQVIIINGPNLNLLGKREPDVYGHQSFEQYLETLKNQFPHVHLKYFQSNIEGEIVSEIQNSDAHFDGIVINAGAYTHTSLAIADAIAAINIPVAEVHISNIFSREDARHVSFMGKNCVGVIAGFGLKSYDLAVKALLERDVI